MLLSSFFFFGCNQPVANSLLTSGSDTQTAVPIESPDDQGQLDIQPDNSTLVMNIDQSDQIEITGSCKDMNRRKNRILVEVFAGDDETLDPYISNAISNKCLDTSAASIKTGLEFSHNTLEPFALVVQVGGNYTFNSIAGTGTPGYTYTIVSDTTGGAGATIDPATGVFTASGAASGSVIIRSRDSSVPPQDSFSYVTVVPSLAAPLPTSNMRNCFAVTKGIGLVEDAGLPTERSFPQCHNGRFGFSVKLGKVLANAVSGQPNQRYTVRFKLRTLDGLLSDTVWSRVTVERGLSMPVITGLTKDDTTYACNLEMSPARFNQNILYTLNRTHTDVQGTVGNRDLFANLNTSTVTTNDSAFSWRDDNFATTHASGMIAGMVGGITYTYTLTAVDYNYNYSPATPPTVTSTAATCTLPRPTIQMTPNTIPPNTTGVCYLSLGTPMNPGFLTPASVTTQWGYGTSPDWVGINSDASAPPVDATAGCGVGILPQACTVSGIPAGTTYFVATREVITGGTALPQVGKWSNVIACTRN